MVKNGDLILKAINNRLRPQLHLLPLKPSSGIKGICISNILPPVVLCITLKPNYKLCGNFVWLDIGLPNIEKESNTLNAI